MARATTSRGARSPWGCWEAMNAWPCSSRSTAPSPRNASESSGRGIDGWWSAVGWNCMNSTSPSAAPARRAIAIPSPVESVGFVVTAKTCPAPPVASTVCRARTSARRRAASKPRTPTTRPHSTTRSVANQLSNTSTAVSRALVHGARETAVDVFESWFATDLVVECGRVVGVRGFDAARRRAEVRARHTVLATGGAGQVFAVTTNPTLSTGDGIAMARRAGAALGDVEFMQFHPTALHHPSMPRPLLSEALRGEGAVLRDEHGHAFMASQHPQGDLAPRDVVARAITSRLRERGLDHLWLDATPIPEFATRFPTISRACATLGLDPTVDWLPVAPAAHYLSGGVVADLDGATTLPGLWAVGEAACSGVHGANRLASNSLLDGLVFGPRAVDAIARGKDGPDPSGAMRGVPTTVTPTGRVEGRTTEDPSALRARLQRVMTLDAGVLRDAASLTQAATVASIVAGSATTETAIDPAIEEVRNLASVASVLVAAALTRAESRGTHTRIDHPEPEARYEGRFVCLGDHDPVFVPLAERTAAR